MIQVIKNPLMPEFRFEYHPQTGKVYWMDLTKVVEKNGVKGHDAFILAEHVPDHGMAFGFVQTFCRAYKLGLTDKQFNDFTKIGGNDGNGKNDSASGGNGSEHSQEALRKGAVPGFVGTV